MPNITIVPPLSRPKIALSKGDTSTGRAKKQVGGPERADLVGIKQMERTCTPHAGERSSTAAPRFYRFASDSRRLRREGGAGTRGRPIAARSAQRLEDQELRAPGAASWPASNLEPADSRMLGRPAPSRMPPLVR